MSACGACSPIPGCRLYRPRATLFLPLLDCAGPVPPSPSVVCTELSGRSFSVTIGACLSLWGRYPRPRVSSVPIRAGHFFRCCLSVRGLYLLPRVSYVRIRAGHVFCRCLSARGLYPFHERHLYRPGEMLIQFHMLLLLECVVSVPPSAGVVCTDLVGRSFSFTCCCCLSVWGLYTRPRTSSVPTSLEDLSVSHAAAA